MKLPPKFHVLFRACDRVHSVHAADRPFGMTKLETIKLSFMSLIDSIAPYQHEITVFGDCLSAECIQFFQEFPAVNLKCFEFGHPAKSLSNLVELSLTLPNETWVYFCEDDYLHLPETFDHISYLIQNAISALDTPANRKNLFSLFTGNLNQKPLVIHPPDYPDRYSPSRRRPGYLFEDGQRHWRQIKNTTHTFMAEGATLRRFQNELRASAIEPSHGLLSKHMYCGLFSRSKALCLSPIPGLTTHMTEGVMTPIVNWAAVAEKIVSRYPQLGIKPLVIDQ